jgi:hypothetical protein
MAIVRKTYFLGRRRLSQLPPQCDLQNGIDKWIAPIRPLVQVKCETDLLRLCFLSGRWFKRRGEKVRLSILFL